jgi:hypothetical protein
MSNKVLMNERSTKVLRDVIDRNPKAVERIGLKEFRFHGLRYSWCSRMCEGRWDETLIEIDNTAK